MDSHMKKDELARVDMIRVETALSRYPVHRLAKQGIVQIELREDNDAGEMSLRWEVSHNSKYGQPGPLAYKVDSLVVNRRLEGAGKTIPRIVRLGSLREIAEATGSGEGNTSAVKRALYQNASAFITAKIKYKASDGSERRIEIGDSRYAIVFTGEKLPDGRTADAVYIILHDFYREILSHAVTRPLDYDYLRELPPAPQRLYELLSYQMYATLKHGKQKAKLSYGEFCTYAPLMRHPERARARVQMAKIHDPHRKAGYIADVEFEATADRDGRPDWTMSYTPGPKAKVEHEAFARRNGRALPVPGPTGLEAELIERGVTRAVAVELVRECSAERIKGQIERADWLREKRPSKVKDFGAYLVGAIREDYTTPAGFVSKSEREERDRAEREQREGSAKAKAQARETEAKAAAYWAGLTPEQQGRLEAEALARVDPGERANMEAGTPTMRRAYLRLVRDAYIREVLGLAMAE